MKKKYSIPARKWRILGFLMLYSLVLQAQQKQYSLQADQVPLAEFIQKITALTAYHVIYNAQKIDSTLPVSVSVREVSVSELLRKALQHTPVTFRIEGNQIILLQKEAVEQTRERFIRGTVVSDMDNTPLPGVSILISRYGRGCITDLNGNFSYLVREPDIENTVLEVSYMGMITIKRRIGDDSTFHFRMQEGVNELSQVVVTSSYGTQKLRQDLVGSIASVTSGDIAIEQASESVDKLLEGQLAGVLVENTSGVGGPVKIDIRGKGSLSPLGNTSLGTSTQPLIIIDGVTLTEEMAIDNSYFDASGTFVESLNNPLAHISPEDIESISVLKDAAAVSLYGADGANGVIIITTKKGSASTMKFQVSAQGGISEAVNQIKYLNGTQFTELRNAYLQNTNQSLIAYNGVDTNWFDLMNRTGSYQKYNFSLSGASSGFNYRTSLTYKNIDEPHAGNGSEQYNININLGYTREKLNVALVLNPSMIDRDTPNIYYNFAFLPTIAPYDDEGNYADIGVINLANPLAAARQNRNHTKSYGLFGSVKAAYELFDNFKVSSLFGMDFKDKEQDRYFSSLNESGRMNGSFILNGVSYPLWGRRIINTRKSAKWNWQTQVFYEKKLNDHRFDILAGIDIGKEKSDFDYANGTGFVHPEVINSVGNAIQDDDPETIADDTNSNQNYQSDINYNSRVSFYSQWNYDYKGKYFALLNFRRDESSVFGTDTNVAYNGGAGLGWIVSKENFLKNADWLDFLKLKISYGTTGNSRIGSYRSKGLYRTSLIGYNGQEYATPIASPNSRLSWEKNIKYNMGIDINVFNRLNLSIEYYYDNIKDMITSRDIPTETGYNSSQLNAANMYNKGWEATVSAKLIETENLKWSGSFNIATLKNKVTSLIGLGSTYSVATRALAQKVGYSTTAIWGIPWVGIDPATGRDLVSHNGQVYDAGTYSDLYGNDAWVPLGDTQPDIYGGFSTKFQLYKNLQIAFRGSYQFGAQYLVSHELISQYRIMTNRNLSVNAYDYWRGSGDTALQPVPGNNTIMPNMGKYVFDDSYIKLNNINISYNIPLSHTGFLDNCSVFLDISNVAYWYTDRSPGGRNGIREFRFAYPQARTISCGIKTSF